jgi:hypothetical protein
MNEVKAFLGIPASFSLGFLEEAFFSLRFCHPVLLFQNKKYPVTQPPLSSEKMYKIKKFFTLHATN